MTILCNVILFRMCLLILYDHDHDNIGKNMHGKIIHEASPMRGGFRSVGIIMLRLIRIVELSLIKDSVKASLRK